MHPRLKLPQPIHPPRLRETLVSLRDLLATAGPMALLALALLGVAYWLLDPNPPRHVVLATGPAQSAYAEFGQRYAELLKRHGITVELRSTDGASDNLRLLRDEVSGVQLAFVQGGSDGANTSQNPNPNASGDELVSLGRLFHEPVWLFYREDAATRLTRRTVLNHLAELPGWRIGVGEPGSGVPQLMAKIFDANRIEPSALTLVQQDQTPAVMAFLAGELDAITFATAPESLMVQMLLQTPGIRLFDFAQAEAYSRRLPMLTPVLLPRGVVDLAADRPASDVRLVAPTTSLLARESIHPALVQLFVQAAQEVHGKPGWFQRKGEFPNALSAEHPLASEAARYYRNGPPLLQRHMPFWLANLIDRMWVVLVSIVAIIIPLSRVVPPLYQFRIRSRVFRWYGQLRALENEQGQRPAEALLQELTHIELRVAQVSVPLSYADELYALRSHIDMVRQRLSTSPVPP